MRIRGRIASPVSFAVLILLGAGLAVAAVSGIPATLMAKPQGITRGLTVTAPTAPEGTPQAMADGANTIPALVAQAAAAPQAGQSATSGSAATAPAGSQGVPQIGAPEAEKTASQVFHNIQVLTYIPADQLVPAMQSISMALGVTCDFCHVAHEPARDDKPEKLAARKMMLMMFAIDKQHFEGHLEVTCYTCHRGASKPLAMPVLMKTDLTADAAPETAAGLPTAAQILAKYDQALGGEAALGKITSRVAKGTFETGRGDFHATLEEVDKAPDLSYDALQSPQGDFMQGYNGKVGWQKQAQRPPRPQSGFDLEQSKRDAEFYPALHLDRNYSKLEVNGIAKVNGQEASVVTGTREGGVRDKIYFSKETGLLLVYATTQETPLGSIPSQTEYSDYREVQGVKFPFLVKQVHANDTQLIKWTDIQVNVPVDDARFDMPGAPAPAGPPKKKP